LGQDALIKIVHVGAQGALGFRVFGHPGASIDVIGPDIYSDDSEFYRSLLSTYYRPDNALWIPETGRDDSCA